MAASDEHHRCTSDVIHAKKPLIIQQHIKSLNRNNENTSCCERYTHVGLMPTAFFVCRLLAGRCCSLCASAAILVPHPALLLQLERLGEGLD
jgi:hypothetical protein